MPRLASTDLRGRRGGGAELFNLAAGAAVLMQRWSQTAARPLQDGDLVRPVGCGAGRGAMQVRTARHVHAALADSGHRIVRCTEEVQARMPTEAETSAQRQPRSTGDKRRARQLRHQEPIDRGLRIGHERRALSPRLRTPSRRLIRTAYQLRVDGCAEAVLAHAARPSIFASSPHDVLIGDWARRHYQTRDQVVR